jgi:hypothetical protein
MFYVYEWFIKETNEIIYVGKGCGKRYKVRKHNKFFNNMIARFNCDSRIIKEFDNEKDAFSYEYERVRELKEIGQAVCNIYDGGCGGTVNWWTEERKTWYSENNVMKNKLQRERMSKQNPMKNKEIANRVGITKRKPVIINGNKYDGVVIASEKLNLAQQTIINWCRRGYDSYGNPCRYANEEQKEISLLRKLHPKATTVKAVLIDGIRFVTVKDGAEYIGVTSDFLIKKMKANKPCKGHNCKYDNQQPSHTKSDNSSVEGSTTNE